RLPRRTRCTASGTATRNWMNPDIPRNHHASSPPKSRTRSQLRPRCGCPLAGRLYDMYGTRPGAVSEVSNLRSRSGRLELEPRAGLDQGSYGPEPTAGAISVAGP